MKKNFLHKCKDSKKISWEDWKSILDFYYKTFMNFKILLSEIRMIKIQPQIFVHFHDSLQKSQKKSWILFKSYTMSINYFFWFLRYF